MDFTELLSPLLCRICEYSMFSKSGIEVPYDTMLSEVNSYLSELEAKCSSSAKLHEQYCKVERALIFFIDYTIKEGGFSYSHQYTELARGFNELSGDEKFFDILNESLERHDDAQVLKLFYLMLGLGFDGVFKRERTQVIELMHRLKQELPPSFDPKIDLLSPSLNDKSHIISTHQRPVWWWVFSKTGLLTLLGITLLALVLNVLSFHWSIGEFVDAVEQASLSARPYNHERLIDE